MTVEEKLEKLTDSLMVEAELLTRHERQANARFEQHQAWLEQLDKRIDAMSMIAQSQQDQMTEFRASAARLFDLLDRFIRGRQGNGHSTV